jgi:putative addiction module component (TIGR02574 family)
VSRTYEATLSGDHLEWKGSSPAVAQPVEVKVEVPDAAEEHTPEGRLREESLRDPAATGGIDHQSWTASRTVLTSANCDFSNLTPAERLDLAEALWTSVDADDVDWTLTPAQRAELDRRLAEYDLDPDAGETWESIREEIVAERAARRASAA